MDTRVYERDLQQEREARAAGVPVPEEDDVARVLAAVQELGREPTMERIALKAGYIIPGYPMKKADKQAFEAAMQFLVFTGIIVKGRLGKGYSLKANLPVGPLGAAGGFNAGYRPESKPRKRKRNGRTAH